MVKVIPQFDESKETVTPKTDLLAAMPASFGVSDIHDALLNLFDGLLNKSGITDTSILDQLAQLRSRIDITLKGL